MEQCLCKSPTNLVYTREVSNKIKCVKKNWNCQEVWLSERVLETAIVAKHDLQSHSIIGEINSNFNVLFFFLIVNKKFILKNYKHMKGNA